MDNAHTIPERGQVKEEHTWNLSRLFESNEAWERGLERYKKLYPRIAEYKGKLAGSLRLLHECLETLMETERLSERLGYYAHLRVTENEGDDAAQARMSRYMQAATEEGAVLSFIMPELQTFPDDYIQKIYADERFAGYGIFLKKIFRFKPHVLSESGERLLALQAEMNQVTSKTFGSLTNVDMDFGTIKTDAGEKPLSQGTFGIFLQNQDRAVRKSAYERFYGVFDAHKHTLSSLYAGSIQKDCYFAKVRNYPSAREASLFRDDVKPEVYDNLVSAVRGNLPALHRYYELRRRTLGLKKLSHYDVYVPLVADIKSEHTYEQAVALTLESLAPLGVEYTQVLGAGLRGRWVDRYENKGKQSGAFSAGSYDGDPYILLNFKDELLRSVFTLAHEAGHSMHSYFSAKYNPFQHYNYTIFEAEVASTFNEQLLAAHLLKNTDSRKMKAYIIGKLVDDVIATIFRQTMFAEFEHRLHSKKESGTPLTLDTFRSEYRELLGSWFGSAVELPEHADLEGLRIPHFYRAFYVYKYATGLSAAIALSEKVLNGTEKDRNEYLAFLKSGGSQFPIESLKKAGVDMSSSKPVNSALKKFTAMVDELETLL